MNDSFDTALEPAAPRGADEDVRERERQSRVLRAASHDIRGPLANVRSYASFLGDPRMELSDKAKKAVEVIVRNADKALALLREFIDSEQAARGLLELPTEAVHLAKVLEKAARGTTPFFEEKGLELKVDEEVAGAVSAEPTALEHILKVLLEHAASRSHPNSAVSVRIQPQAGGKLSLAVIDTGPALSADEQAALFDREAWLLKQRKLSLGFRLSLAAAEARTMGGELSVDSTDERTALTVRLPVAAT